MSSPNEHVLPSHMTLGRRLQRNKGECRRLTPRSAFIASLTEANKGMSIIVLAMNQWEDKSVERESIWVNRLESIINDFWIIHHSSLVWTDEKRKDCDELLKNSGGSGDGAIF